MATQQQRPATTTSSEDGTSSYSSYSGTNSYTGQSSLTSSVQIHNYNEVDENSTLDSKPAAFENGLQSLTTTSLIQQRIQQQGEVSACSTNTKEFSLPSSFGGGAGTDGSTINDTIASDTIVSNDNDNDGGSSTRASASIGSRNTQQERNDLLQKQQQQQMEVYNNSNQELVSVNSSSNTNLQLAQDNDNINNSKEDQLTIRISKETKPMMHLLRMLKEMDTNDTDTTSADNHNNQLSNNTNNNPKNKAISSLISDFEQEVTLIEHRIKDETKIVNYDDNGDNNNNNNEQSSTSLTSSIQPLPPNWIALEDPNSGDVYYANEVTGVTQWERPGSTTNSNSSRMNDSRSTFNDSRSTFNDSYNQSGGSTLNDSRSTLNDSYQSNNNKNKYNQQSTTSTTFIGNVIQKSDILRNSQLANSFQDSRQSNNNESFQDSRQSNNNYEDSQQSNNMSSSYTNMSSSLNDSAFTSTTETTTSTNIDDNDLPPDWIAIIDSDTGETYYANEVTGESTWEKPILHQQQPHQSVPQDDNVSSNNNDDDELPDGWVELQDEDSGDIYYLNQMTMTTTWDRPRGSKKVVEEDVGSNDKETGGAVDDGPNENVNRPQDEDNDDDLPPGWFTAVDQDSGDTYYCNEATGETTWDKPTIPTTSTIETSDREQHTEDSDDHFGSSVGDNMRRLSISGDFENSDNDLPSSTTSSSGLPLGWFAAVDEQSGDTYYCNEATGETTWDLPTQPAIVEDDTISSNTNSNSNQGGESQDDQLPNGWFSVTDPASGDVYYCNEVTGETTWDKPTIDKATTDLLLSRTSNNVDPTVYEDDSVTSSKGY